MSKILLACLLSLFFASCYRVPDEIDPKVSYRLQDQHFERLNSAFNPLSEEEKHSDWGKEFLIAKAFTKELDLYRAISTFKRAEILLFDMDKERKLEIQYDMVLCLFLGKKYQDAVELFERSDLCRVDKTFFAYHDLLLVLYECYHELDDAEKQGCILEMLGKTFPETGENLQLSQAIREGDLSQIVCFAEGFNGPSYLSCLPDTFYAEKKSVGTAQFLNAIFPGAGYLYIGQHKSAFTAFLLNGLFVAAAYQFFHRGHLAAGIITSSFEAGWYFGGIYGAGEEAKYYNERLYEKNASTVLNEHCLFPTLMMKYEF